MSRTISYRALKPDTLARYEAAERDGSATPRQLAALRSHRGLPAAVQRAHAEAVLLRRLRDFTEGDNANSAWEELVAAASVGSTDAPN